MVESSVPVRVDFLGPAGRDQRWENGAILPDGCERCSRELVGCADHCQCALRELVQM